MSSLYIYNQVIDMVINLPYCIVWMLSLVFNVCILAAFINMARKCEIHLFNGIRLKENVHQIVRAVYLAIILYGVIVWNPIALGIVYMTTYKDINYIARILNEGYGFIFHGSDIRVLNEFQQQQPQQPVSSSYVTNTEPVIKNKTPETTDKINKSADSISEYETENNSDYQPLTYTRPVRRKSRNTDTKIKSKRTAFSFFTADTRDKLHNMHPTLSFGQITKLVGEQWKNLNEQDHTKYIELETADKLRYEAELQKQTSYNSNEIKQDDIEISS